jgi:hypothetical protein
MAIKLHLWRLIKSIINMVANIKFLLKTLISKHFLKFYNVKLTTAIIKLDDCDHNYIR